MTEGTDKVSNADEDTFYAISLIFMLPAVYFYAVC